MPSSSSSEEEDLSKFREAADTTFYDKTLFQKGQAGQHLRSESSSLPSLRRIEEEEESKLHQELRVTPAFQDHVAKHLSKLLESQLAVKESSTNTSDSSNQTRSILKAKRSKNPSSLDSGKNGGVKLFGASAVFLANMNLVPARKVKRARKVANSSSSGSSNEDSDSNDKQKVSAAAVSPDWILSGAATNGWARREGKVERVIVNKAGVLVPVKDEASGSLSERCSSNNNCEEIVNNRSKDDLASPKQFKLKKHLSIDTDFGASQSSIMSLGSDSQGGSSVKRKKKKKESKRKRRRHRKEQYSEDATTETTEVEDAVEERRQKVKKAKRKSKRMKIEEEAIMKECVPGLFEEDEDTYKKRRKKEKKKKKEEKTKGKAESYLKKKNHHKLSKVCKRTIGKKIMLKKVQLLSDDLAKLMVNSSETS